MITVPSRFEAFSHGTTTMRPVSHLVRCISIKLLPKWQRAELFFTEHNRVIRYEPIDAPADFATPHIFRPQYAPTLSEDREQRGARKDTFEISGGYAPDPALGLTRQDFLKDRVLGARVRLFRIDHTRPWLETPFWKEFYVTKREPSQHEFRAYCEGMTTAVDQPRGDTETRTCRNELGDVFCGIDLDDQAVNPEYRMDNAIANQSVALGHDRQTIRINVTVTNPAVLPFWSEPNWFAHGTILSGAADENLGVVRKVRSSTGLALILGNVYEMTVVLNKPLPANIESGVPFTIYVGCDKFQSTCRNKFTTTASPVGNFDRFRGVEPIGTDRLTRSGDAI